MEKSIKNPLQPGKKVMVVPVRRKGGWLPPGHEAEFLFKHSAWTFILPKDKLTGHYREALSTEERAFFESGESGLALKTDDLSIYKKQDNFWDTYKIKLDKNLKVLDLGIALDYITYKVLLQNKEFVAPTAKEKFNKGSYKFCLTEEGYENEEKVKAASSKKDAYKFFGKIDEDAQKMIDFLNVYYTQKPGGKQVPPNAKIKFLIAEIEKLIESDLTGFLEISKDASYDEKVLIYSAMKAGALERDGMTFKTPEGTIIGDNIGLVLNFLADPLNSEEVIKIKGRIENTK
tara:strand:- start:2474 stop:3340 length:867 start_codon:yes stop_codon:yes gene_type:complete